MTEHKSVHLFSTSVPTINNRHIQMKWTISTMYPWITLIPFFSVEFHTQQPKTPKRKIKSKLSHTFHAKPDLSHEPTKIGWLYLVERNGEWFCWVGCYLAIAPVNQDYVIALQENTDTHHTCTKTPALKFTSFETSINSTHTHTLTHTQSLTHTPVVKHLPWNSLLLK